MYKIDQFCRKALESGTPVRAFLNYGDWMVKYFDPEKAGKKPLADESRDEQDFELRYAAWMKAGEVYSAPYTDFDDMIDTEMLRILDRLALNGLNHFSPKYEHV